MKVCVHCRNSNEENANFCKHCRTPFGAEKMARPLHATPQLTRDESLTQVEDPEAPFERPTARPVAAPPRVAAVAPVAVSPSASAVPPSASIAVPQLASIAVPRAQVPQSTGRTIVGVLVTYSWNPEGRMFAIREGRNLIGRGEECDIRVPEDNALSNVNSHITYRRNFVVGDMVSLGGTDLNGEPVEEQFRPMENYAQIRTGSTYWTFVMIRAAG